jgi:hypothetical protein
MSCTVLHCPSLSTSVLHCPVLSYIFLYCNVIWTQWTDLYQIHSALPNIYQSDNIFPLFREIIVLYSTLFHLPPLCFHCVGGCRDQTQDYCDFDIGTQTLYSPG